MAQKSDILMKVKDKPGPLTLIRIKNSPDKKDKILKKAAKLTLKYAHLDKGIVICSSAQEIKI